MRKFASVSGMFVAPESKPAAAVIATYQDLREIMGGPVQAVRLSSGITAYVREDAVHQRLPYNAVASVIAQAFAQDDFVSGPMILFGCLNDEGEWDGHEYDCPVELWNEFGGPQVQVQESEAKDVALHTQRLLFSC